jgi:hypothetical protein
MTLAVWVSPEDIQESITEGGSPLITRLQTSRRHSSGGVAANTATTSPFGMVLFPRVSCPTRWDEYSGRRSSPLLTSIERVPYGPRPVIRLPCHPGSSGSGDKPLRPAARGKVASPSHCYLIHVCVPHHCLHRLQLILTIYNHARSLYKNPAHLLKGSAG